MKKLIPKALTKKAFFDPSLEGYQGKSDEE